MKTILTVSIGPHETERHFRAQKSLSILPDYGVDLALVTKTARSAKDIGDTRELPFLKDILRAGLNLTVKSDDVVIWTNDDVQVDPEIAQYARTIGRITGAISMRRSEPGTPDNHLGRELFIFTKQWLVAHWDDIPDFLLAAPAFDIVLAALIRKDRGIASTLENMAEDIYPCDSDRRYAIHEPHQSSWAGSNEFVYQANKHNLGLAKSWCAANMPSLRL